jgi:hypothetical protein
MFGGDQTPGELWQWDGMDWTQLQSTGDGPVVSDAGFVYDPLRARAIVYGGLDLDSGAISSAVWEWDGSAWSQRTPGTQRRDLAAIYDPVAHRVVAFGGMDDAGVLADTWQYGFASETPRELCIDTDTDHDGLVGCADPDCWGICTPYCMPNSPCDTSLPHCGDGTCQHPLEDRLTCPADCNLTN